jgi:membrane protein DedA with SNARE-associated domain
MTYGDQFKQFATWNLVAWCVWAAMFGVLEFLGVKAQNQKYATLTYLCTHAVPTAVLAAFCGWLLWHFTVER